MMQIVLAKRPIKTSIYSINIIIVYYNYTLYYLCNIKYNYSNHHTVVGESLHSTH